MPFLEHMILAILEAAPDASVRVHREPEARSSQYTVTADLYVVGHDGTWRTGQRFSIGHSFSLELAGDHGQEQGRWMAEQIKAGAEAWRRKAQSDD